jgi:hypothetical protein
VALSGSGDDPPDDPRDEPRARDIAAAKSTADLEEKLAPETIAQLAAWFGLPSFQQLEEERAGQAVVESEHDVERRELREKIDAAVDHALLARIESWRGAGDAMFDELVPPELHIADDIRASDSGFADRLGVLGEGRTMEPPRWIEEELSDNTPQAVLRDLYRPETTFAKYLETGDPEPGFVSILADIRTAVTARYTVRPEPPVRVMIHDALAELRHWKAARWGELDLPKRAPKASSADAPGPAESEDER